MHVHINPSHLGNDLVVVCFRLSDVENNNNRLLNDFFAAHYIYGDNNYYR